MKKVILICCVIFCLSISVNASPEKLLYDYSSLGHEMGDYTSCEEAFASLSYQEEVLPFISYFSTLATMNSFFEKPDLDTLLADECTIISKYRYRGSDELNYVYNYNRGKLAVTDVVVANLEMDKMAEYVSNDYINELLKGNGIESNVNSYSYLITDVDTIPDFIWVNTDVQDYFISVEWSTLASDHKVIFKIYDKYSLKNAFSEKRAKIVANGKEVEGEYYATLQYNTAFVPIRTILQSLGSTVVYDAKTSEVYFNCGEETMKIIRVEGENPFFGRIVMDNDENKEILPLYGIWNVNGHYMVKDSMFLNRFIKPYFDAEITFDYENAIIYINQRV